MNYEPARIHWGGHKSPNLELLRTAKEKERVKVMQKAREMEKRQEKGEGRVTVTGKLREMAEVQARGTVKVTNRNTQEV